MHLPSAPEMPHPPARASEPRARHPVRRLAALTALLLAAPLAQAGFTNGGFESGDFTGWTLKSYKRAGTTSGYPSSGINPIPPTQFSHLKLTQQGAAVNGAGLTSSGLSAVLTGNNTPAPNAASLTYPRWGQYVAKINNSIPSGTSRDASSIEQTATMTAADVDPNDGKVHVRFGMAPVLYNPSGHAAHEQPFFYVEVNNLTKGTRLFTTFNYANQPGAPWQGTVGDYLYTDWTGFDIAPGNGQLDIGDEVQIFVVASNCSKGAASHEARVYLDAVGAFMPGLTVTATGPTTTHPGEQITYTYTYTYTNNTGVLATDTKVRVALPVTEDNLVTSYVNGTAPASCTGPHPGTAPRQAYLECDVGTLNSGQSGNFQVTYTVPAGAATTGPNNVVNNGDYNISASSVSAYQGPMVKTDVVGNATPLVDLGVTVDNGGLVSYGPGAPANLTVTVTNHSATDAPNASVTQTLSGLTGATWTCAPAPGSTATCGATSGTGPVTDSPNLPANQSLIYTITGTTGGSGAVNTTVTVAPPSGISDSNALNNTDGLNVPVGAQVNVTANASGAGMGHILSVPAPLACGDAATACTSTGTTKAVGTGDVVYLTPVAHPGSIFTGWVGCSSVSGDVCQIVAESTNVTATANFEVAHLVTPSVPGGGGSVGPSTSPTQVLDGGSLTYTLTPEPGYYPRITPPSTGTACTGTLDTGVTPNTYTVSPVTADCGFTVTFVPPVTITSSVDGGNGSITPAGPTGPLVPGNNSTTFTLTPEAGYTPVVSGTCPGVSNGGTYTVVNTETDCTVIASFTDNPVAVTSTVTGGGGTISTLGTVNLERGGTRVYTLSPEPGFFPSISGSCQGTLSGNTYTVGPVDADCAFDVTFTTETVTITTQVTGGTGTVTPPGPTVVGVGGGETYTATPSGTDVAVFGGSCPGVRNGDAYSVVDARADCEVQVKFVPASDAVTVTTSVSGGNGAVSTPGQDGNGRTVLERGDSRVWTVTPADGFVPRLAAGSTCQGTLSTTAPYTYTVNDVQADCVANFMFVAATTRPVPTLDAWALMLLSGMVALFVGRTRRRAV